MRKPIILKLGGGNGSGKSSIARALLGAAPTPFYDDLIPGKVAGYTCEFDGAKIRVLGRYESACGGIDSIGKIDKWLPLVEKYSTDDTVDIVFFEGILSGQTFGRCGAFSNAQIGRWIYSVVDAPVEVCLERILERRRAKGNLEGRSAELEKSVKNAHRCAGAVPRLAAEQGHSTLVLDHTKTPKALAKRLVKACLKARDAGCVDRVLCREARAAQVQPAASNGKEDSAIKLRVGELARFVLAREQLRINRQSGLPRSRWTDDPVLQKYRFCNVHREDDRVTIWIRENWRQPHIDSPLLWFGMLVARFFNEPAVLEDLRVPPAFRAWEPSQVLGVLHEKQALGQRVFNAAYMIRSDSMQKTDYVVDRVLTPIWKARRRLSPRPGEPLAAFAARMLPMYGMGGFMIGQMIADAKYGTVMRSAPDWSTWAVSGPGSRRGMNRVLGRPERAFLDEKSWLSYLGVVRSELEQRTGLQFHAQDTQNCLCEFGKYERARLGEGRPKQLFVPLEERSV